MAKPIVSRLEKTLSGKAEVIRLDLLSVVGREAAARYGVRAVPTLIVVDGKGQVTYGQYGIPRPSQVVGQVDAILASR